MTRPTLLVTGSSGFIGRALLETIRREGLDQSYRIVLLTSRENGEWEAVADGRLQDGLYSFTAEDFVGRGITSVDYVIHLGAFTPKVASAANDAAASVANIRNTLSLLENLPNSPRRIVLASSVDVYGPTEGPITEGLSCQPTTLYGMSKLFCERMLTALEKQPRYSETSLQILRIGHTYGPGEGAYRKFIPETIRRLLAGEGPRFFTDGSEKRSFIHVGDCSRLILAALDVPPNCGPINIASPTALSLKSIADHLCRISRELGGPAVAATYEPQLAKGSDVVFDVTKMVECLGDTRIGIEEGLRDEFLAFKSAQ